MKKGGATATRAYNESISAVPVAPSTDAARTRGSAVVSWPLLAASWVAGFGVGGTTVVLADWLVL